jgi:hypothetical protein
MFKGIIIFFVVCAVIGFFIAASNNSSKKEGAAMGALAAFGLLAEIAKYALPVVIIILLVKACS